MEKLKNLIIALFILFVCYLSVLNYLETKKLKLSLEKSQLKVMNYLDTRIKLSLEKSQLKGSDEGTAQFKTDTLEFLYSPPSIINRVKGETVSLQCSTQGDISEMKGKWTYSDSFCDGVEIKSEISKSSNMLDIKVTATKSGVYECQIQQKESIIKKKIFVNFATIESNILNTAQKQQLIDWFPPEEIFFNYVLCFKYGTVPRAPEGNCKSLTKTLTIIKDVKGCIFGGYSSTLFSAQTVGDSFLFDFQRNMKFEARSPHHVKNCSCYDGCEFCFGENDLRTIETYGYHGSRYIYSYSKVGSSYDDHGLPNATLGCSDRGSVSLMEIFYQN